MAQAIYAYEGNRPPDRAYRNNNPGDLRDSAIEHEMDSGGYCVFASFVRGYMALKDDLLAKMNGNDAHDLDPSSSLLEVFQVYAPAGDNNAPAHYADFVALWLNRTYGITSITRETTVQELIEAWDSWEDNGKRAA